MGPFSVHCAHTPPEASTTITPEAWTSIAPELLPGFIGKPEMSRKTADGPCFETIYAVGFLRHYTASYEELAPRLGPDLCYNLYYMMTKPRVGF